MLPGDIDTTSHITEYETPTTSVLMHKYLGRMPSFKYLFKDGVEAIFMRDPMNDSGSVYYTSKPEYIAELDHEVNTHGHPYIYIDKNEPTVASDMIDPVAAYRNKLKREIMLEMEAEKNAGALNKDMGEYQAPKINPNSSNDLAEILGGSTKPVNKVVVSPGQRNDANDVKIQRPDQVPGTVTPNAARILSVAGLRNSGNSGPQN